MNEEICKCGHPKNTHMPFDKPAFCITHICGVNLCDCEQFRPTPRALDKCQHCNGAGVLMTAIGSKLCPRCEGSGTCQ